MVKGLDYALLQKIRSDHDKPTEEGEEEDELNEEKFKELSDEMKNLNKAEHESDNEDEDRDVEDAQDRIKISLKPKILSKTNTAALAIALNRSLTDAPFPLKK